mmetsp:Transcript_35144/g.86177  ORF Transcript_35144/g.86177 Transcript_35144/m.86177 type:complete len:202 (+) Transcript_35144:1414-2019(+)
MRSPLESYPSTNSVHRWLNVPSAALCAVVYTSGLRGAASSSRPTIPPDAPDASRMASHSRLPLGSTAARRVLRRVTAGGVWGAWYRPAAPGAVRLEDAPPPPPPLPLPPPPPPLRALRNAVRCALAASASAREVSSTPNDTMRALLATTRASRSASYELTSGGGGSAAAAAAAALTAKRGIVVECARGGGCRKSSCAQGCA